MIAGLSSCVSVPVTPSTQNSLSVQNPIGAVPKLVHVTCSHTSNACTTLGWIVDAWYTPLHAICVSTFTGGTNSSQVFELVLTTPSNNEYVLNQNEFSTSRGNASTGVKWDTNTEYIVEFYS